MRREVEALAMPFVDGVEIVRRRRGWRWPILEEVGRRSSRLSPEPSGTKGSDEGGVGRDEVDVKRAGRGRDRFSIRRLESDGAVRGLEGSDVGERKHSIGRDEDVSCRFVPDRRSDHDAATTRPVL